MSARAVARVWLAAALLLGPSGAGRGEGVPEPRGYRLGDYRAEVPATLSGATVVSTDDARSLWRAGGAVFIDVMPRPPRPANLPAGTVWQDPRRDGIPGSHWLPNVGYGRLSPAVEDYFRSRLLALAGGRTRPVLFYCLARCWMSWNAAKRALAFGHANVIWYPAGSDGWEAGGLPLEKIEPVE